MSHTGSQAAVPARRTFRDPAAAASCRALRTTLALATCLTLITGAARAAKWHECPAPPLPVYPSIRGATTAPFIHPGHDLTVLLNDDEVAASGGFSLAPLGNQISIVFHSLFGDSVTLPPQVASASSPWVLHFVFPDSETEVKQMLAGPVSIRVVANGQEVAHISWTDLVGLPPPNDVTRLVLGQDPDQVVLAAMAADGDVWVPATFHGDPMEMPSCPGNFMQPLPIQVAAAEIVGGSPSVWDPLKRIRGVGCYLGDLVIGGDNFYGMLLQARIGLVHVGGTLGVSICRVNDAIDLVLRVHGAHSWSHSPSSPFRSVAWESRPIGLRLVAANPIPFPSDGRGSEYFGAGAAQRDSFGASCSAETSESEETMEDR
ncbi:MAG: hypothetical protein ACE5I7_01380 [Candidatus Binatia bacterium]